MSHEERQERGEEGESVRGRGSNGSCCRGIQVNTYEDSYSYVDT